MQRLHYFNFFIIRYDQTHRNLATVGIRKDQQDAATFKKEIKRALEGLTSLTDVKILSEEINPSKPIKIQFVNEGTTGANYIILDPTNIFLSK